MTAAVKSKGGGTRGVATKRNGAGSQPHLERRLLTEADVRYIRRAFRDGDATGRELAEEFDVTQALISNIVRLRAYLDIVPCDDHLKWIASTPPTGCGRPGHLSNSEALEIAEFYDDGTVTVAEIADAYGTIPDTVIKIGLGQLYRNVTGRMSVGSVS